MTTDQLIERVQSALNVDDTETLDQVLSEVDWAEVDVAATNQVLQLLGAYGYSDRTQRYEGQVKSLVDGTTKISLISCAYLHLNEIGLELLNQDHSHIRLSDLNKNTALHAAAERGNIKMVEILVSQGAKINALNERGETPLHLALHAGPWKREPSLEIVAQLINHGARVDLFTAAQMGNNSVIEKLSQDANFDVNGFDNRGRTALFHASRNNHLETVRLILSLGADPNLVCEDGQTPLSTACLHSLSQECDIQLINTLVEHGAEETLEAAIVRSNTSLITKFVQAEPNAITSKSHESSLAYAIHTGNLVSLECLLRLGAKPDETNWGHIQRIFGGDQGTLSRLKKLVDSA